MPIRTPPRLSVESLRPVITNEPRGVARSQSPCRQRPGKSVKYASRSRLPVGVGPERHRHRRHRLVDHQLADVDGSSLTAGTSLALLVDGVDVGAQRRARQLPQPHRHRRRAGEERGADSSMSGGTDVRTAFLASAPTVPVWLGELSCAALGADVHAVDEKGATPVQRRPADVGELVINQPMPSMPVCSGPTPTAAGCARRTSRISRGAGGTATGCGPRRAARS